MIAGNSTAGVYIRTYVRGALTNPYTIENVIAGNWIGTNAAGTAALGNGPDGVLIASGSHGQLDRMSIRCTDPGTPTRAT